MVSAEKTHGCLSGCRAQIPMKQVACAPCWDRLPEKLRGDVTYGLRNRRRDPQPFRKALSAAYRWFKAHRLSEAS